jgi:hypothetical protein
MNLPSFVVVTLIDLAESILAILADQTAEAAAIAINISAVAALGQVDGSGSGGGGKGQDRENLRELHFCCGEGTWKI